MTIITWNAAMVFGKNMEDVLTLLELANVHSANCTISTTSWTPAFRSPTK